MTSIDERVQEIAEWPADDRLQAYTALRHELWLKQARPEQLPPEGEWRTWYLMGGRGSGKSWTGAQQIADWEGSYPPGVYAIVAPVLADAVKKCVEETLLPILGPRVSHWNRSLGELYLKSGSQFYCDGADDGADRIQGFNLRGVWADEVGLWAGGKWEAAWYFSILPAVRLDPGKIIATGTPKMGHPLVRLLVEDEKVPVSHMHTSDNISNLSATTIADLYGAFPVGTLRHRQELEGEWVSAIEGDALKRAWWRYYSPSLLKANRTGRPEIGNGEIKFQWVIVSVDAPQKDKQSSDNVAIQVWGVDHANRYLLDAENRQMSYDQAKRAIREKTRWARYNWRCQSRLLIENAGIGPELIVDLQREVGGVEKIKANVLGNKGQRALSASESLETGNCFLPGRVLADGSGPDPSSSPALTISLVEEAAMFHLDGSHDCHDDQVDAWSQAMNWLRSRQTAPARTWSSFKSRR